jgi:hypothetical protein
MLKRKRYNLTAQERIHRNLKRAELIQQKEKVFLTDEWSGYCDNTDHPLFSIKVTKQKPYAACYYCSKLWMLTNDKED